MATNRKVPARSGRRKDQGGYAILLVFLMAAMFAIMLYREVPRVSVESERAKEQLLIERGEQYKRAIQLFYRKTNRYPAKIEELESFQNQRFLRHRYIDPMTGKDEWRMIHVSNGVLTDSKINKPQKQGEEKKDNGTFAGVENSFGSGTPGNQQGGAALAANRRRSNDSGAAGSGPELPAATAGQTPPQLVAGQQNLSNPQQAGQPGQVQPIPGVTIAGQPGANGQAFPYPTQQGQIGQMGQVMPGQTMPGQTMPGQTMPGQTMPGQFPNGSAANARQTFPGQQMPGNTGMGSNTASSGTSSFGAVSNSFGGSTGTGSPTGMPLQQGQASYNGPPLPQQPGSPVNSQTGGVSPYQTNPSMVGAAPGIQQPGTSATPPTSQASDMINRILTTPRPGGMPTNGTVGGGAAVGNGIAGFASNAEGEGIMVYNDHQLYAEWEFIFDPQKQKQIPNPNATGAGTNGKPASEIGGPANAGFTGGNSFGTGSPTGAPGSNGTPANNGGSSFGGSNSFGNTGAPTGGRGGQPQSPPTLPGR
ncbi:MAG TPA: hypothetical protein VNV86_09415 [Candidatus Acidoferrum sp.]|nr:hypothetical protein [Candidatus Acidoferrum sp.]